MIDAEMGQAKFSFWRGGNSPASASFALTLERHPWHYPYTLPLALRLLFHAFVQYFPNCSMQKKIFLLLSGITFKSSTSPDIRLYACCYNVSERRNNWCPVWRWEVVEFGLTTQSTQKVCIGFFCELWGSRSFPQNRKPYDSDVFLQMSVHQVA